MIIRLLGTHNFTLSSNGEDMAILEIFGTPEELRSFALIFFGSLIPTAILGFIQHRRKPLPLPGEQSYDITLLVLGLWCMTGLLIDVWAHTNGEVDDSFFTKWHAVWYSGATAYSGFILFALWRLADTPPKLTPSGIWNFSTNVPKGHGAAVAGIAIFTISGFADMVWHTLFGIEGGLDILLSPSHLGLLIGLILTVMAPVFSGWQDPKSGTNGLSSQLVLIFGFAAAWVPILLITGEWDIFQMSASDYCYLGNQCGPGYEDSLAIGVIGSIVPTTIATGLILTFSRRWTPATGTMLILFIFWGISNYAMEGLQFYYIYFGVGIGLLMEVLSYLFLRTSRPIAFAIALPIAMLGTRMFAALTTVPANTPWSIVAHGETFIQPYGWTIHATSGSIIISCVMCALLAAAMYPPEIPTDVEVEGE